jgi:repressor of nif and glnA expression
MASLFPHRTVVFRTSIDLDKLSGKVPVNVSLFPEEKFADALRKWHRFLKGALRQ